MSQFAGYAKYYDDMYAQKPYDHEVDQLEAFWQKYSPHPVKTVLSLGCGTGTYEILLAKRGYTVVGVDLSADMLSNAKEKIDHAHLSDKVSLFQGDIRDKVKRGNFDAVIMMFNIAGYMHSKEDMSKLAINVAENLKEGGTFVFDAWNEPSVVADPPSDRTKVIEKENSKIIRTTKGVLDTQNKLVKITFHVSEESKDTTKTEVTEDHPMRYWGRNELTDALSSGGLTVRDMTSFADSTQPISEREWDIYVIATK